MGYQMCRQSSSSSSCSLRVRCVPCSLILEVELVPPSLLRSSNVPSSFWSVYVQTEWNKIKNLIVEAAKESFGEKGKRNEGKFDKECRTAIQEKNNMRLYMKTENGKVGRIEN